MKLQITQRWSGRVIFEHDIEDNTMLATVKAALASGANLRGADLIDANLRGANLSDANLIDANLRGADLIDANLSGANLSGADLIDANLRGANLSDANLIDANLRGANLIDANLRGANLSDANLSGANLSGADLIDANLRGANLRGADLIDANLRGANLRGADLIDANLRGANLSDANLRGANLSDANLTPIRDDIWAILSAAPAEVPALIDALKSGRVDGSTYEGECACLVGTIAKASSANYNSLDFVKPNASRPAERFFMGISKGDTPETNQFSKLALEWSEQWLGNMRKVFAGA